MSKGPHPIIRLTVYPVIAVCFLVLFYFLALSATGYKLDYKNGKIIRTATGMIVVATKPGDARVSVDGKIEKRNTPLFSFLNLTIKGVSVGEHTLKIEKDGYVTWEGLINIKPKLVSWADYIILVPEKNKPQNFKLPGNVVDTVATDDKSRIVTAVEETKTGFRTYWDINLQTKEKQKIREEKIVTNEKIDLVSYNYDATRVLVSKVIGEKRNNIVFESKLNGTVWDISNLFQINFDNLKFSPYERNVLFVSKDKNLYSLNYEAKSMSAVIAGKIINFYTNNSDVYFIKETEGNIGLWKYTDKQKIATVVKVLPLSDSYQFKHLKATDSFLILSNKDKELFLYQNDNNGNPISKRISTGANHFLLSPKEERVLVITGSGVKIYDIEKNKYYDVLKDKIPESIVWLNDKNNIIYSLEGKVNLITYNGQYNKFIFNNLKGTSLFAANSSPNVYFLNQKKEIRDIAVYNFDF